MCRGHVELGSSSNVMHSAKGLQLRVNDKLKFIGHLSGLTESLWIDWNVEFDFRELPDDAVVGIDR